MTSEEFLVEVLASEHCPNNFESIYSEFQKFQHAAYETLLEFHRVCEKYGINYQLAFGSLLGAIRDGGQIPWDYDIDVFISYENKMKLVEALQADLDSRYYFFCPEIDASCRHVIMRLAPKNFRTEALHVDVFYYVETAEETQKRQQHMMDMKNVSNQRFYKLVNPREEAAGNLIKQLKLYVKKIPMLFKTEEDIKQQYNEVCARYRGSGSSYCISADSFADWYAFPTKLLSETTLLKIGGSELRVPVKYVEMLAILYSDYAQYPSLIDRIKELMYNYNRLKYFGDIQSR